MYHPFRTMPSVNDELAALRAQGAVRTHAQTLSAKSPRNLTLSTPEAEEAALKAKREADKLKKKEAEERLRKNQAGMEDASVKHSLEWRGKKREDMERAKQAREILVKGTATAGGGGKGTAVAAAVERGSAGATAEIEEPEEIKVSDVAAKFNSKTPAPVAPAPATVPSKHVEAVAKDVEEVRGNETVSSEPAPTPAPAATPVKSPTAASTNAVAAAADDDDDDVPELEEPTLQPSQRPTTTSTSSQNSSTFEEPLATANNDNDNDNDNDDNLAKITNRTEKKARKFLSRLDLRPVPGITRVTLKTGGGRGYFVIDRPDVFCSTEGSGGKGHSQQHASYVIFGEAKHGGGGFSGSSAAGTGAAGGGANAAAVAAQAQAIMAQRQAALAAARKGDSNVMESVAEEEEVEVPVIGGDGEGVEEKDVELVMSQASCSRAVAVKALKENDNDLVNAIMSLTT